MMVSLSVKGERDEDGVESLVHGMIDLKFFNVFWISFVLKKIFGKFVH